MLAASRLVSRLKSPGASFTITTVGHRLERHWHWIDHTNFRHNQGTRQGWGHLDRINAVLRISVVVATVACALLAGCASELSLGRHNSDADELSVEAVAARAVREARASRLQARRTSPVVVMVAAATGSKWEGPLDTGWVFGGNRRDRSGVPVDIVSACRSSIVEAGKTLGVIWVDTASAGPLRIGRDRTVSAPLEARVVYEQAGFILGRQSHLTCRLSPEGAVLALM